MQISERAVIGKDVTIGENTIISPNVVIEGNVIIGENNYIGPNTYISGNLIMGNDNWIGSHVTMGYPSQHSKLKYEFSDDYTFTMDEKKIFIGNNNVIREFSTIHQPTLNQTSIFNNAYLMVYSHISHDTQIYDNVILTNNCQIGGHTKILNYAHIGLSSVIHPRSTIGGHVMVGMNSTIVKDIPPFVLVRGNPLKIYKLNLVGLERYYFNENEISEIKQTFELALENKNNFYEIFYDKSNYKSQKIHEYIDLFKSNSKHKIVELGV